MSSEQLSEADSQFRNGNFDTAVALYARLLSEIELLGDNADLGSVVLKVAECHYAAGNFDLAKQSYEKLLALQDSKMDFSSKDRIFTLVKAAKNYEKCDDQIDAQLRYEQAYELAKTALSAKHFLRRTVIECYAQWLRLQKTDPLLLSILESELGVIQQHQAAQTEEVVQSEKAQKRSGRNERRQGQQDFADIKSKLGNKKKVSTDDQTPSPKLPQKKLQKSVGQLVTERKFLSFSNAPKIAKTDRSRLKDALVEGLKPKPDLQSELGSSPLQPEQQDQSNLELLAEAASLLNSLEQAKSEPVTSPSRNSNSAREILKAEKLKRQVSDESDIERLLEESARLIYSLENLSIEEHEPVELPTAAVDDAEEKSGLALKGAPSVAMRQSSRSFFGQEEDSEGEQVEEVEEESVADTIEKALPTSDAIKHWLKIAVPIAALLTTVWFTLLTISNSKPEQLTNAPKFVHALMGKDFDTANGAVTIAFTPDGLELRGHNLRRKPNVYFWQGTVNDDWRLLQGTFNKCVWLSPSPEGIKSSIGQIFYRADAPEKKVIDVMNSIKNSALVFYQASGRYPNPDGIQPSKFINPVSGKYEDVNICSMNVGKDRPIDADTRLDSDLERGQFFNNEPPAKPGSVSVFCVVNSVPIQNVGDTDQSSTQNLYIHGFDKNGEMIKSGDERKVLLVTLKPTGPKNYDTQPTVRAYEQCDICLSNSEVPSIAAVAFKYILVALLISGIVGFIAWARKSGPH